MPSQTNTTVPAVLRSQGVAAPGQQPAGPHADSHQQAASRPLQAFPGRMPAGQLRPLASGIPPALPSSQPQLAGVPRGAGHSPTATPTAASRTAGPGRDLMGPAGQIPANPAAAQQLIHQPLMAHAPVPQPRTGPQGTRNNAARLQQDSLPQGSAHSHAAAAASVPASAYGRAAEGGPLGLSAPQPAAQRPRAGLPAAAARVHGTLSAAPQVQGNPILQAAAGMQYPCFAPQHLQQPLLARPQLAGHVAHRPAAQGAQQAAMRSRGLAHPSLPPGSIGALGQPSYLSQPGLSMHSLPPAASSLAVQASRDSAGSAASTTAGFAYPHPMTSMAPQASAGLPVRQHAGYSLAKSAMRSHALPSQALTPSAGGFTCRQGLEEWLGVLAVMAELLGFRRRELCT